MTSKTNPVSWYTGRRFWLWTAVVISLLVLILATGSIVGVWVSRSIAIQTVNSILDGVYHMATVGREGVAELDKGASELYLLNLEINAGLTQLGQKVSDRSVVMTLLPPEKVQSLEDSARSFRTTCVYNRRYRPNPDSSLGYLRHGRFYSPRLGGLHQAHALSEFTEGENQDE